VKNVVITSPPIAAVAPPVRNSATAIAAPIKAIEVNPAACAPALRHALRPVPITSNPMVRLAVLNTLRPASYYSRL
jgi:hypothetical protein